MIHVRIAIDTGGTFTDCVWTHQGELKILKLSSTPSDPSQAVLDALRQIAAGQPVEIRHGTTVGTNALHERKGVRTAFITTAGFEDIIAIGRQARPKLYDLFLTKDPPLVPEELRFGVQERTACDGTILEPVQPDELQRIQTLVAEAKPESIAISLLFAFANPANEQAIVSKLRELGVPVSAS